MRWSFRNCGVRIADCGMRGAKRANGTETIDPEAVMAGHAKLPAELKYLQPFVTYLSRLPPEELDESVDSSKLDAALRKRIAGMSEDEADEALHGDWQILNDWLKGFDSSMHPAHWVWGYLSGP